MYFWASCSGKVALEFEEVEDVRALQIKGGSSMDLGASFSPILFSSNH